MRIREAQRLIYGSLTLLIVGYLGSAFAIRKGLDSTETEKSFHQGTASNPEKIAFDFPSEGIWADSGVQTFTKAIEQYQLAGTFQIYESEEGSLEELKTVRSLALIDDLETGKQLRVSNGDQLGPFFVTLIEVDQVTLEQDEHIFVLGLSGEVAIRVSSPEADKIKPVVSQRFEDMPALETSRFGKRISDNQWVIDRQQVFSYAEEIMGNPLRAAQLFMSFSQTAKAEEDVAGFGIKMKGEREFFGDMGLGDGDIIRKVNSMQMKSQLRAEYLVREFMNSRMSAVVLDVENDGETRQQIFIIR